MFTKNKPIPAGNARANARARGNRAGAGANPGNDGGLVDNSNKHEDWVYQIPTEGELRSPEWIIPPEKLEAPEFQKTANLFKKIKNVHHINSKNNRVCVKHLGGAPCDPKCPYTHVCRPHLEPAADGLKEKNIMYKIDAICEKLRRDP